MPRVALFVTCLVDNLAPDTGVATVELLEAAGCEVDVPAAQSCCGQPAVNTGEPEAAETLARRFVETFEAHDAVVSPSGSCVAMVHHWYPELLGGRWHERALALRERTHELSAYLVDVLGRAELGARVHSSVTLHDACHGLRVLGLRDAGRTLLEHAGARIVEMRDAEVCCGFGGTFAERHAEISAPMADEKLERAAATGADYVVTGDPGCILHLEGRRRRTATGPPVVHLAELLATGLGAGDGR